jgi:hypothetical protein
VVQFVPQARTTALLLWKFKLHHYQEILAQLTRLVYHPPIPHQLLREVRHVIATLAQLAVSVSANIQSLRSGEVGCEQRQSHRAADSKE